MQRTYPVELRVTDYNQCENLVRQNVVVYDLFNLYIPNSFTPNNDGYNDAFYVKERTLIRTISISRFTTVGVS